MIFPSPDRLQNQIGSKYALVIVAAKRARMIKENAPPLVRCSSINPLTVALEEVAAGKVIAAGQKTEESGG